MDDRRPPKFFEAQRVEEHRREQNPAYRLAKFFRERSMKKIIFCTLSLLSFCVLVFCEEDPLTPVHKSLKDQAFAVETDENSVSDSLNRISGKIDLGFSAPEQSYDSSDHYRPGPFGRQEATDHSQSY